MVLTRELFQRFYDELSASGRRAETIRAYSRSLNRLYEFLPEGKRLRRGSLEQWRRKLMEEGFAAQTVNGHMAAANSLLEYCGRRELQVQQQLRRDESLQPELSRGEYLRLLSTAKAMGKEQTYLLVKLFAATGLSVQELPSVTVEAVETGRIPQKGKHPLYIPNCLRQELHSYAKGEGILSGAVFRNRNGKLLHRSNINVSIRELCRMAQVPEDKGNPRCLCRLYQETKLGIQANMDLLIEQAHERLMEKEQLRIGWKE